jgi:hypothetical protein
MRRIRPDDYEVCSGPLEIAGGFPHRSHRKLPAFQNGILPTRHFGIVVDYDPEVIMKG